MYSFDSFRSSRLKAFGKMKQITVAAAVIIRNNNGTKEVFCTQRGYGEYKGWWEFPGGKKENAESFEQTVVREIKEELNTLVKVNKSIGTVEYDYPEFHLTMNCLLCSIVSGSLELLEHESSTWLNKDNIQSVKWLGADLLILDKVKALLQ